jgi:hypothetical protein
MPRLARCSALPTEEAHAANRENRRIIAALTQHIPELETLPEPPKSSVSTSEGTGKVSYTPPPEKGPQAVIR